MFSFGAKMTQFLDCPVEIIERVFYFCIRQCSPFLVLTCSLFKEIIYHNQYLMEQHIMTLYDPIWFINDHKIRLSLFPHLFHTWIDEKPHIIKQYFDLFGYLFKHTDLVRISIQRNLWGSKRSSSVWKYIIIYSDPSIYQDAENNLGKLDYYERNIPHLSALKQLIAMNTYLDIHMCSFETFDLILWLFRKNKHLFDTFPCHRFEYQIINNRCCILLPELWNYYNNKKLGSYWKEIIKLFGSSLPVEDVLWALETSFRLFKCDANDINESVILQYLIPGSRNLLPFLRLLMKYNYQPNASTLTKLNKNRLFDVWLNQIHK